MAEFSKGDKVSWSSHGSTAHGEVVREITSETEAGGRTVKGRKDGATHLVKSQNGGEAVNRPDALTKE